MPKIPLFNPLKRWGSQIVSSPNGLFFWIPRPPPVGSGRQRRGSLDEALEDGMGGSVGSGGQRRGGIQRGFGADTTPTKCVREI